MRLARTAPAPVLQPAPRAMAYLAGIFALLTGAAGWYYLFYSRAAERLSDVEDERINARRVRLRRAGGVAMLMLGGFLYAGFRTLDNPNQSPGAFLGVWLAVFTLLAVLVVLALIDVRLTHRLRARQRGSRP
jgi:hypothetical protein